jgi:hypothetical protein
MPIDHQRFPQFDFRPSYWQIGAIRVTFTGVIRAAGAPSISMGRTVHEVRDEMCRLAGVRS